MAAANVGLRVRTFFDEVSHYYRESPLVKKWTPALGIEHWKEVTHLADAAIDFCNPGQLKTFAEAQKTICQKDDFYTQLKTHVLATSLFMFIIGSMAALVPIGITATVIPIFLMAMAASTVSLIVGISIFIIGKIVLNPMIDANTELFEQLDLLVPQEQEPAAQAV